jgi:hypothetical protein
MQAQHDVAPASDISQHRGLSSCIDLLFQPALVTSHIDVCGHTTSPIEKRQVQQLQFLTKNK